MHVRIDGVLAAAFESISTHNLLATITVLLALFVIVWVASKKCRD